MVTNGLNGAITDNRQITDSFWGPVLQSAQTGLGTIANEILPNWVASQLHVQRPEQGSAPTYVPKPSVNTSSDVIDVTPKPIYFDFLSNNQGGIFLLAIAAIGLIIAWKVF